jgi:hypothetical protein
MTKNDNLQALNILQTLAAGDPDYPAWAASAPHATLKPPLPPGLAEDGLSLLAADPRQTAIISALRNNPASAQSYVGVTELADYLPLLFLLRTHCKFKIGSNGKWEFLLETKALDSKTLQAVLNKLAAWLGDGAS